MTTGVITAAVVAELLHDLTTHGGFTFDPSTGEAVRVGDRDGWAIARAGTERIIGDQPDAALFGEAFARTYAEAVTTGGLVGGWHSDQRRAYMVEITDVHDVDRATALVLGMRADQETVFSLTTGETAPVPTFRGYDQ
jgi:hypothetical protein